MRRRDFRYSIPSDRIARYPTARRGNSRLLYVDPGPDRGQPVLRDMHFKQLPELLRCGDLLVFNDSRTIPARLFAVKETGGRVEILLERITGEKTALAQMHSRRPVRPGAQLRVAEDTLLSVEERREDGFYRLRLPGREIWPTLLRENGCLPLPPYLGRGVEPLDRERYQTIYARRPGSVATPTAGLHFTRTLLDGLSEKGIEFGWLTLHVGAATFLPVRTERLQEHVMHRESLEVSARLCAQAHAARQRGNRIVAVGTTTVRALETAARGGELQPYSGETDLFIYPGYRFQVVDSLLTNFHLPESTLLMLVCAFAGRETVLHAYRHAIDCGYRFYSYGDATWFDTRSARL